MGGDLVEVVDLVPRCFEMHGRDAHNHSLNTTPLGFFLIPQAWYFRIGIICAVVYICDFDRSDPLVLSCSRCHYFYMMS